MPSDPQNADYVYHFGAANSSSWFPNFQASSSSSSRLPPPSYEAAISGPELPSRVVLSNAASGHASELNQVVVDSPSNDQQPQLPPPEYSLSDANFKRTQEGVCSDDDKLNKESESLLRFFQAHNDKPQMAVSILGYHQESRTEHYVYTDDQGRQQTGTRQHTQQVTDFHLNLDLTEYISEYGKIITVPKKDEPAKEVKELLEEYIKHRNSLKEIEMRKVVNWEYESISRAITAAIRSQGYTNYITISYPLRNHIVAVHSNTKLSRFARHP
ncbi:7520_t:CDS:2, partial [Ambispora leptoticha]